MQLKCIERLPAALAKEFPAVEVPADLLIVPEQCPEGMQGDITINCFRFARNFKAAPDAVAAAVEKVLASDEDVMEVASVKAFVNVTLKAEALFRDTLADTERSLKKDCFRKKKGKKC